MQLACLAEYLPGDELELALNAIKAKVDVVAPKMEYYENTTILLTKNSPNFGNCLIYRNFAT